MRNIVVAMVFQIGAHLSLIVNFTMYVETIEPKERANVICMGICPTKISAKTEKKYKEKKMKEIMDAVCGLLNTNGGELCLTFDRDPPNKHVTDCIRMIEQRLKELTACSTVSDLTVSILPQKLNITLTNSTHLITLNYNLYLPSECQVMLLPSSEPKERIRQILQGRKMIGKCAPERLNWHFVQGHPQEDIHESKFAAHKHLKENPSKCVTLADRITGKSNKLKSYVSAFANYSGGHIYYGIDDDKTVHGERITEEDKEEIIKKVTKTMKKMIWPEYCGEPQKGKHWDLYFEPVVDINCNIIPSTYVIIIYVAQCPGGVFTEVPESYQIVNDRVVKMRFDEWKWQLIGISSLILHRNVPRITWSSGKNRTIYNELTKRLVHYQNDKMMREFTNLGELAIAKYPESSAVLVFVSEQVAVSLKYHHFQKAKKLFREFKESFKKATTDHDIFAVRKLYLKSRIQRAKGEYAKSYETAKVGVQMMEQIPAEFMTVWFYMHAATLATILLSLENPQVVTSDLRLQAKEYLRLAARDVNELGAFSSQRVSDLKQKLHIYMASVFLGCSITGKALDERMISDSDVKAATSELSIVQRSSFSEAPPTCFREIQFLLAQSDLFSRYSPDQEHQNRNLKRAFKHGREALHLARESQFEEMIHYANVRLANLTQKFIRNVPGFFQSKKVLDNFEDCIENFNTFY